MYQRIAKVSGDIVECGLGEGNTFLMLAYLAGRENVERPRTLRGFDSFEGWPAPAPCDQSWRNPQKGEWAVLRETVEGVLSDAKIAKKFPNLSVIITQGFLCDSLPKEANKDYSIAFLHLDLDLYDGYRDALIHLWPLVSPGGVVCFDEYKEFSSKCPTEEKWPGATKAIDEFFSSLSGKQRNPLRYYPLTKKYFVVKDRIPL